MENWWHRRNGWKDGTADTDGTDSYYTDYSDIALGGQVDVVDV